ncbi:MAG: hypothetical protein H6506_02500 [Calditrichaeota bacterium]|nr:hypothetical protein [Calditrichota bacterium]MCB9391504.1 hypothetical protein [Calditrichota bacterium]
MIKFIIFLLIVAGVGYGAYWYFFKADQRLLDQARDAISKGDYNSAINDIEQLVSQHPQSDKVTRAEELKQEAGKKLRDELDKQIDKLISQDKLDSAKAIVKTVREKLAYLADNVRYAGDMEKRIAVANAETAYRQAEDFASKGDHAEAKELLQAIKERHGQTDYGRRAADWLNDYKVKYKLTLVGIDSQDGAKFDPVIINASAAAPDFFVTAELNGSRVFLTDIVKDKYAPRWNKTQDVVLHDSDVLTFNVYDDDGLRGNEKIAKTSMKPSEFATGKTTLNSEHGTIDLLYKLEIGPAVR